ncbi:MAG: hypothetical protein M3Y08_10275 [Fibrobacterota bacterium]|nr:hypothetical protein [Fibrobacterota bacterium]
MMHKNWMKTGLAVVMAAGVASAHLTTVGLKPTAGESVKIGDTYSITWTVQNMHGGTDIALSMDGGNTWADIKKDHKGNLGLNTFDWTVAGNATTTAKIRICQHNSMPINACAANDTNALDFVRNGNYVLVSKAFTLIAGTSSLLAPAQASGFSLDYNPGTRNVDVSFGLAESKPVLLQAFDPQGRLLATLVSGEYAAGSHRLSLFSNRLYAPGNSLVFKLKIGNQIQSHNWTLIR